MGAGEIGLAVAGISDEFKKRLAMMITRDVRDRVTRKVLKKVTRGVLKSGFLYARA